MSKPLNEEKSRRLRPLRIVLAILIAILIVLILEKLPTSVKDRPEKSSDTSIQKSEVHEGTKYYYLNGFLDRLEEKMEDHARELGVPEEEFKNISEYLSKEEIIILEAKATLAANLESVYVEVDDEGLERLKSIFELGDNFDFSLFRELSDQPNEYKILSELLEDYDSSLNKVEDYDAPLE